MMPLTCCRARPPVAVETGGTGSADEAGRDVDALEAVDPGVAGPPAAGRGSTATGSGRQRDSAVRRACRHGNQRMETTTTACC